MVSPANVSLCILISSAMTTVAAGFAAESSSNAHRGRTPRRRTTTTRLRSSPEGGGDDDATTAEDKAAALLRSKDRVATYNAMMVDAAAAPSDDAGGSPPAASPSSRSSSNGPDAGVIAERRPPPGGSDVDDNDRAGALRRLFESFGDFGNADATIPVGSSVVVAGGVSVPSLGLHEWQSYELLSVYDQIVDEDTGLPTKIPRRDLKEARPPGPSSKCVRYAVLYSERYHAASGPVLISPDEIELVSVRDEVIDSVLVALPIFGFWTALAVSFANFYNERYGGNFLDALFRT